MLAWRTERARSQNSRLRSQSRAAQDVACFLRLSLEMFDLNRFSLSDMTRCGMELRRLGDHASGMEEVGERVVRYLYEPPPPPAPAPPACVLVRVFVTHPFSALDDGQRAFVE